MSFYIPYYAVKGDGKEHTETRTKSQRRMTKRQPENEPSRNVSVGGLLSHRINHLAITFNTTVPLKSQHSSNNLSYLKTNKLSYHLWLSYNGLYDLELRLWKYYPIYSAFFPLFLTVDSMSTNNTKWSTRSRQNHLSPNSSLECILQSTMLRKVPACNDEPTVRMLEAGSANTWEAVLSA